MPLAEMKRIGITMVMGVVVCALSACATTHNSPKPWNNIAEGASRSELICQLGEPAPRSSNVDTWVADGWRLRVTYDEAGYATDMVRELIWE
jgi:hypothetical protein